MKALPINENLRYKGTEKTPDIKIFVSHRIDQDSETIDNSLFIPVRCGAIFDNRENIDMLGDDTGENISEKRNFFCELTVQYWAWKNIKADYYGLCHYRRYFSFSNEITNKELLDPYNFIHEKYIDSSSIKKHSLDKYNISDIIENDIICNQMINIAKVPCQTNYFQTVKEHFLGWGHWIIPDSKIFNSVRKIIKNSFAKYLASFDFVMNNKWYYGFNLFIMKKDYFNELCNFEFSVLFELEKEINYHSNECTLNGQRILGFVGEILYTTFLFYLKKETDAKIMEKSVVYFENTERDSFLKPISKINNLPIVFVASDFYIPYLSVFIYSILKFQNNDFIYDFIIFNSHCSEINKTKLKQLENEFHNISIRIFNCNKILSESNFYISSPNYAPEAYFRVFAPWILKDYDKILIMDSDIIANGDISPIFNIELGENLVAGVKDIVYQCFLNGFVPDVMDYTKNTMKMKNPYDYINTGVMVMNLKKWRDLFSFSEIMNLCNTKKFRIQEQDIINTLVEGKCNFLDLKWNFYTETNDAIKWALKWAPVDSYNYYYETKQSPILIHYASQPKPWINEDQVFSDKWWALAKETPFYNELLARFVAARSDQRFLNIEIENRKFNTKINRFEKLFGISIARKCRNIIKKIKLNNVFTKHKYSRGG